MKRTIKHSLIFIVFLLLVSACTSYKSIMNELFAASFKELQPYNTIIVIPEAGCPGCISQAEYYFKQNWADTSTLFIFTNMMSKKMLKGKLKPIKLEELNNVIIDTNNVFYLPDYHESIYPYVFSVHDGSIADAYVLQ